MYQATQTVSVARGKARHGVPWVLLRAVLAVSSAPVSLWELLLAGLAGTAQAQCVTTEVSHADLEIKKGLLFKVGKQKDHILASAFPQVCRNEINFKKALEFSGNENNQMNIFADAKYSYRFSLGKFVLNLAKNMTIIYGKNRGCINYSDSKITKTSLKFLCKTSKMFLTTF